MELIAQGVSATRLRPPSYSRKGEGAGKRTISTYLSRSDFSIPTDNDRLS